MSATSKGIAVERVGCVDIHSVELLRFGDHFNRITKYFLPKHGHQSMLLISSYAESGITHATGFEHTLGNEMLQCFAGNHFKHPCQHINRIAITPLPARLGSQRAGKNDIDHLSQCSTTILCNPLTTILLTNGTVW